MYFINWKYFIDDNIPKLLSNVFKLEQLGSGQEENTEKSFQWGMR